PDTHHSFPTRRSSDLNTYKEGYTLINSKQSDELSMHLRPEKRDEVKHSAVSYHDMAFLGEPIATVTNSRYAAAYIQQLRFSAKPDRKSTRLNSSHVKI